MTEDEMRAFMADFVAEAPALADALERLGDAGVLAEAEIRALIAALP